MLPTPISDSREAYRQRMRMRRFLMALGTSFVVIGLMFACYVAGILSGPAWLESAGMVLLVGTSFYFVFRSGLNLRFPDPNLTVPQMLASTLVILYAMYAANGGRAVFLMTLLMIFLFGVLQLAIRPLLACAAVSLFGYAGVIGLLARFRPEALNLRLEILQWCALAITLPWFAVMGGFIGGLRTKLKKRNEELQGLLQRVQASEAGLAQAQRIAGLGGWVFDPLRRLATWSLETYRLFGIDPAQPAPIGKQFLLLVHPDDRDHYHGLIRPALRDGRAFDGRFRIVRPSGELRWVQAIGEPLLDAAGRTTLLRGTLMDITEQHVQAEALTLVARQAAAARASLIDAIESLGDAFALFDADDRLIRATAATCAPSPISAASRISPACPSKTWCAPRWRKGK